MKAYKTLEKPKYDVSISSDSMTVCDYCGSKKVVKESTQLRSADEEPSVVYWCIDCDRHKIIV